MSKKVGEVLFLGAVTVVVGFCWKAGSYGATILANKIYDKITPPRENPYPGEGILADLISPICPCCNPEIRPREQGGDGNIVTVGSDDPDEEPEVDKPLDTKEDVQPRAYYGQSTDNNLGST